MRRVLCTSLISVAGVVALLMPSVAEAHRAPTALDVKQITQAASFADATPGYQFVRVTGVKISTAGPWASATVSLYQKKYPAKPEQVSDESFFRANGKWHDTTAYDRTPPKAVASDLGLEGPGKTHTPKSADQRASSRIVRDAIVFGVIIAVLLILAMIHENKVYRRDPEAWERRRFRREALSLVRQINNKLPY